MAKTQLSGESPKHVALIVDGNRRYASKHGWKPWKGHEIGFDKLQKLIKDSQSLGVKELTLYCFSVENFTRDEEEIEHLFKLFRNKIDSFIDDPDIREHEVRIRIIGRLEMFPEDMQRSMRGVMNKTKHYNKFRLNLCMAYGGRQEIVDAVKEIVQSGCSVEDVSEELLSKHMYLNSCPDLLIRPGGEKRLSNFLTWESIYSELIFVEKLWPEFTKQDLIDCIDEFKIRQRRFGK